MKERIKNLPLRWRLALWYVGFMGLVLLVFGGFQYFQLKSSLFDSVNTSLNISVSQALSNIDMESGQLVFQSTEFLGTATRHLGQDEFAIRLLAPDGTPLDGLGATSYAPLIKPVSGYTTNGYKDESWQIYTQPIYGDNNELLGWLQSAEALFELDEVLDAMLFQLLLGLPLALLLAAFGGVFLANRALRPIDEMTKTARDIGAGDLSRRMEYEGPPDEIGRLAQTFDEMLARLQSSFVRERRFTGDAAHELRTPLTALKGQIEVSLSRVRDSEGYQLTLGNLLAQVDRLIRLSNALLFLSRSDQEQLTWHPTSLNLAELLEPITEQVRPLAEEKNLTVDAEIPASLPLYGDADHLIQLFLNLLDNAVKYTPAQGQINLKVTRDATQIQVEIHNTGTGIPPEHLPHLFERFYRVEDDRSSQSGGTGLGLAIAHEIVRMHGGEIHAESQARQGVTFIITLPLGTTQKRKQI